MRPHCAPLREAEPLRVRVECQPRLEQTRILFPLLIAPRARLRRRVQRVGPARPVLVADLLHEHAEEAEILQPSRLRGAELCKLPPTRRRRAQPRERTPQQHVLQFADAHILHRARAELLDVIFRERLVEKIRVQLRHRAGIQLEREPVERDGTDRIVRAAVAPRRIDRQELHHPEPRVRRPVREFAHAARVPDAEVALGADCKSRNENTSSSRSNRRHHRLLKSPPSRMARPHVGGMKRRLR